MRTSRGSLYELIDHLQIAVEENYIDVELYNQIKSKIVLTIKVRYINYLIKKDKEKNH